MSEVKKEDIEIVVNALQEYVQKISDERGFNPQEFVNFIEPKFSAAGYRYGDKLPRPRNVVGNILIIHDASVGDFILMSGTLREIRRLHPTAKIRLLVAAEAMEMARFCPYVNEIIAHDSGVDVDTTNFASIYTWALNNVEPLLNERIDICYSFTHFYTTQLIMYMCGAKIRYAHMFRNTSAENNLPFMLHEAINILATNSVPPFLYGNHHVDCYFSFLDAQMNIPIQKRNLEVWCKREEIVQVERLLGGRTGFFYAMCMGGNNKAKHYPPEKYAKVVEMILAEEDATFVILGGGTNDAESAEIFMKALPEDLHGNIIDLTNKINYRYCAALLTLCTVYMGNDTGIMHAAAAVHLPILTVSQFPADLPKNIFDGVTAYSPYQVPSVVIQPSKALDDCANTEHYSQYGCKKNEPHCIAQIAPETFVRGVKLLKERVRDNLLEPLYIV